MICNEKDLIIVSYWIYFILSRMAYDELPKSEMEQRQPETYEKFYRLLDRVGHFRNLFYEKYPEELEKLYNVYTLHI